MVLNLFFLCTLDFSHFYNIAQYPVIASVSEAIQWPYEMLEKVAGSTMSQRFF